MLKPIQIHRRTLLKTGLAASAAMTLGIPVSASAAEAAKTADEGLVWHKGVCRFCGTGCGLLAGVRDGRIVATKGDPDAPVNRGLNCVKGYFNAKIMYGRDRLTTPLMRRKNGHFDKNGRFEPVSWDEALDEMARQLMKAYRAKGPDGIAIIGSGQYTIPEAYTASKLMKGGLRSNNIDPNARLCMASAVVGFYQTFGVDEPANNYDDIEKSDLMILWGNNMAEAHPVLWSRVANRRLTEKRTRIVQLTTHRNSSSNLSDLVIVFRPNTDLAIANFLQREIVKRGLVNKDFVQKHCIFAAGVTDIGYGLRNNDKHARPAEKDTLKRQLVVKLDEAEAIAQGRRKGEEVPQKNSGGTASNHWEIPFAEYAKGLEPYTLDFVAELAKGDPDESLDTFKQKLMTLADLVCNPKRLMMSFWCMGVNQHQRGVWMNELIYSIHLLLGKHGLPGCGAFSLTGQPSACGSAREVGAFSHRLPSDMLVANPAHRAKTEKIWNLPAGTLNPKVGRSCIEILRGIEDGAVDFVWTQVVNILQSAPNNTHFVESWRRPDAFIVVSDIYPTYSARAADLILPAAAHFEKWGLYGNGERRTQGWHQLVEAPGEARTDIWMMMALAQRIKIADTWGELPLAGAKDGKLPSVLDEAKKLGISADATLFDVLFAPTGLRAKATWPDAKYPNELNATGKALGIEYFPEKALFTEYRTFTLGGHDLADFDTYMDEKVHGLLWPVVNGKETPYRFNVDYDPYAKPDALFYGKLMKEIPSGNLQGVTDKTAKPHLGKAKIFFRPYAAPVEQPDSHFDLWLCTGRILEHWHTGSMTRRVPELYRAAPQALLYMNPSDAEKRGLKRGDLARVESRYGACEAVVETQSRNLMPKGSTWLAFFDEKVRTNAVTIDATDPLSLEPDYKKTAVLVKKA